MYDCTLDAKPYSCILRTGYNLKDDSCIAKELYVMRIYSKNRIPVPKIFASDVSRKSFPFDYIIMQKFFDKTVAQLWGTLNNDDKAKIAFQMGRLLKSLHSIKVGGFGNIIAGGLKKKEEFNFRVLPGALKNSSWTRQVLKDAFEDLSGIISYGALTTDQCIWITKYLQNNMPLTANADAALIHNDFNLEHIFVKKSNNDWAITGLVDVEFVESYAKEFDFIKLHRRGLLDDKQFKSALFKGYGISINSRFDELVKYYRIVRDLGFAYHLLKAGDMTTYKKAIEYIMAATG